VHNTAPPLESGDAGLSMNTVNHDFWTALDTLVAGSHIVIDRPQGSAHPRYPDLIYPRAYGYLDGTRAADGGGIDVWLGSGSTNAVDAIVCTIDLVKRDSEIKVLIGCSLDDRRSILDFMNRSALGAMLVERAGA
jgi:inorganic pyrophosphatase